jgi:hypothetical protein
MSWYWWQSQLSKSCRPLPLARTHAARPDNPFCRLRIASRLETLTKQLGRTVLLSRAFSDFVKDDFELERVGEYPVRGFNDPIGLFAYHG